MTAGRLKIWNDLAGEWEYAPGGGGGGGSGPADYVQIEDPGTVGAGKTWLQLPPLIDPDPWAAETPYVASQRVQPTTPNGHYYQANGAGTSGAAELDPWPTDGGSSDPDGDITWLDLGVITAVQVTSLQLWYRNDTDDGWLAIGIADRVGNSQSTGITMFAPDGAIRALFNIEQDFGGYINFWSNDEGANSLGETWIEPSNSGMGGAVAGAILRDPVTGLFSISDIPTDDPMDGVSLWRDGDTLKFSTPP